MNFSRRMERLNASGIRVMMAKAKAMKDPINLGIGQPHFSVPELARKSAIEAIEQGSNAYSASQGMDSLIDSISEQVSSSRAVKKADFDVLVTSGVSGAINLAFWTLLDEGDEVILTDPYFVMYEHLCTWVGAKAVKVSSYPDFDLPVDKIAEAITDKTKLIILNSPGNPSGVVYNSKECEALASLCKKHGIWLLSDEIYEDFLYDGLDYHSPFKNYERCLLVSGISKSLSATGWRIGHLCGPADFIAEATKLQQYSYVCAPTPFQVAAENYFSGKVEGFIKEQLKGYQENLNYLRKNLPAGLTLSKRCQGAIYAFVALPEGMTSSDFCQQALEQELILIPGKTFSQRDTHFRLGFSCERKTLEKGVDRLTSLCEEIS